MFRWKTHSSHHRGQVDNKHTDGATSHEQKYFRKKHKKIEKNTRKSKKRKNILVFSSLIRTFAT